MLTTKVDDIIRSEMSATSLKIAAQKLDKAAEQFNEAEKKYNKLRKFRQDYVDKFKKEIKPYSDEYVHESFASFFVKLDIVIYRQKELLDRLKSEFKTQQQMWKKCQQQHQKLERRLVEIEDECELIA